MGSLLRYFLPIEGSFSLKWEVVNFTIKQIIIEAFLWHRIPSSVEDFYIESLPVWVSLQDPPLAFFESTALHWQKSIPSHPHEDLQSLRVAAQWDWVLGTSPCLQADKWSPQGWRCLHECQTWRTCESQVLSTHLCHNTHLWFVRLQKFRHQERNYISQWHTIILQTRGVAENLCNTHLLDSRLSAKDCVQCLSLQMQGGVGRR